LTAPTFAELAHALLVVEGSDLHAFTGQDCMGHVLGFDTQTLVRWRNAREHLTLGIHGFVLAGDNHIKRATLLEYLIKVAEECNKQRNFASMSAIVLALSPDFVGKLPLSMEAVKDKHRKSLTEMQALFDWTKSCEGYKNRARKLQEPFLPFFEIDLGYLTEVHLSQKAYVLFRGRPLVNYMKLTGLYHQIVEMLKFQTWYTIPTRPKQARAIEFMQNELRRISKLDLAAMREAQQIRLVTVYEEELAQPKRGTMRRKLSAVLRV